MSTPPIVITAGKIRSQLEPWSPETDGQSDTFIKAVEHAGGMPYIAPLVESESAQRQLYDMAAAILIPGGNDPDPALYGELPYPQTIDVSPERDQLELRFIRWALEEGKPLLGICRGMELLNIELGGTLYQHIPTDLPHASDHNSSTKAKSLEHSAHRLSIVEGSQLAMILEGEPDVNSHHHQAIKKLGARLVANAFSEDGLIEGIEYTGGSFAIGVQGHPESLEAQAEPVWRKLFSAFVLEAVNFQEGKAADQLSRLT